jgi:hypothetical protein
VSPGEVPLPRQQEIQHWRDEKQRKQPASREPVEAAGNEISEIKAGAAGNGEQSAESLRAEGNDKPRHAQYKQEE